MSNVSIDVFQIARTAVDREEVKKWLARIGADEYEIPDGSVASDPALLVALAAKRCYMSFQVRFLQDLMNRRQVGYLRYEQRNKGPNRRQRYISRLATELKAYRRSGNAEQLLNIAVYAYLESRAPENPKFHFDNTVQSVTRHSFYGEESA